MKFEERVNQARLIYDIHSIVGSRKRVIVCPLPNHKHHNHTPSFSIFWERGIQRFHCFGSCGAYGDVVDLIGYLSIPFYDSKKYEDRLAALNLLESSRTPEIVIPPKTTKLASDTWKLYLPPGEEVIQYAARRGLTLETLKLFHVGQCENWMTIPAFENRTLTGIKMRNMGEGLRYMSIKGSRQGLFNFDRVAYTTETVFVAKGEIAAMMLCQSGYTACAPTAGEGGWNEEWRTALALAKVIVIGDNDDTGRTLGERRATLLNADLVFPPENYKDIDEFMLAEPETSKLFLEEINAKL